MTAPYTLPPVKPRGKRTGMMLVQLVRTIADIDEFGMADANRRVYNLLVADRDEMQQEEEA